MKGNRTKLRVSILIAVSGMLMAVAPQTGQAQICPGSKLTYIVRDTRGGAIDAKSKDLQFNPESGAPNRKWRVSTNDFITSDQMQAPDSIKKLSGMMAPLETEEMCVFRLPVRLHLTLEGKTMNLTFLMPKLDEYDSRDFLVDSLPFRQGTFEIELSIEITSNTKSHFYPARGWKEVK